MITSSSIIGKMMRLPLRAIPKSWVVPVLGGPLRGGRWVSGASVHGCWLGWYEKGKAEAFRNAVGQNSVVWDIGANVGYYTLIAASRATSGRVYAFEPLPSNVALLHRHLELNRVENVTVLEVAVSDHEGEGRFEMAESNSMGHLGTGGKTLRVRLVGMDEAVQRGELPAPTHIKMDIEGAEYDALRGGINTLKVSRPILFLATHGAVVHDGCCSLLRDLHYDLQPLGGVPLERCSELVARPKVVA